MRARDCSPKREEQEASQTSPAVMLLTKFFLHRKQAFTKIFSDPGWNMCGHVGTHAWRVHALVPSLPGRAWVRAMGENRVQRREQPMLTNMTCCGRRWKHRAVCFPHAQKLPTLRGILRP